MAPPWPAPPAQGPVRACVRVPGSKSITNRALVLAALAEGPSRVTGALRSRDTELMAAGLRALGVDCPLPAGGEPFTVTPAPLAGGATVDCGNAGTVARFLPAVAALARGTTRFVGDPRMSERPLAPLLDALRQLGAQLSPGARAVPFAVTGSGGLPGGSARLDASPSSQLVSGLLLAGARFRAGLDLTHSGPAVPSAIQVEMTVRMLAEHGVAVRAGADRWQVEPGPLRPVDRAVEPDLSSASAFLAAAAATAGRVRIPGWPAESLQPGRLLPGLLAAMGCRVELDPEGLTVTGPDRLTGLDVDLSDYGEAVPTLTALATLAESPSRFRGVGHLRLQETDRLAALAAELGRLGARIQVLADGLAVTPAPLRCPTPTVLDPHADHRLAMAFAVVALVVPGVHVADIATTGKTVPDFPRMWAQMLHGAPTPG